MHRPGRGICTARCGSAGKEKWRRGKKKMKVGLLWYDDDPGRDLAQKVGRAVRRYRQKYGRQPNVCYVHPSVLEKNERHLGKMKVAALTSVLRNHFWIGEEEEHSQPVRA
jgi:hypothetical protein